MKGQSLEEIPFIGLIGTFTIVASVLIPPLLIKTTIDKETVFNYEYEKTQYALLSLLSSTHDGKEVSQIIAENINTPENLKFLESDLNKIIKSGCYSLQVEGIVSKPLVQSFNCNKKYTFTTSISLPYSPDSGSRIKLLRIDTG